MPDQIFDDIQTALLPHSATEISVHSQGDAELPSCFPVTDLAVASIRAAAVEMAGILGEAHVTIDRALSALWFDMTLRPEGWQMPSVWDDIAGAYQTSDGWIRLHTNAPHHRQAALRALGCDGNKTAVADTVASWGKDKLEAAVVAEGGAAAAMHSPAAWVLHPQGQAVASEPLIAWEQTGAGAKPVAFDQLRVLDLTRVLAGPVATRFLAGFGADVLRIDPPSWNEPGVEPEVTLGKRRAGLDLTRAEDRAAFEGLVQQADVLVHGYRPGALAGLGYGQDRLQQLAPHMINVSLCAYGWSGPWAGRRGFDSLVQMSCGIAHEGMQRKGVAHPVPLPVQALDHATGYLMATAVLRALSLRNQTGDVFAGRLSLARTAVLLTSQGARDFQGAAIEGADQHLHPRTEMTSWGPAKRLRFPVKIGDRAPHWPHPAGALRIDAPGW